MRVFDLRDCFSSYIQLLWLVEGSWTHMVEADQVYQCRFPSPDSRSLKETDHIGVHTEQKISNSQLEVHRLDNRQQVQGARKPCLLDHCIPTLDNSQ